MMSINTSGRAHFKVYLLNSKTFGHKIHIVMGNFFSKNFSRFGDIGSKSRSLIKNQSR